MFNELSGVMNILEKINTSKQILTFEEITDGQNSVSHFKNDLKLLVRTLQNSSNPSTSIFFCKHEIWPNY